MKFLNKQELKYITLSGIFLLIFFLIVIPNFYNPGIKPWIAFLVFNFGVLAFMQLFLKSVVTNKRPTLKMSIGIMFLILAFSIISPPLSVKYDGVVNINMFLGNASADFNVSNIYSSMGISGFFLYFLTYWFTSILCLLMSAIFIKNFLDEA